MARAGPWGTFVPLGTPWRHAQLACYGHANQVPRAVQAEFRRSKQKLNACEYLFWSIAFVTFALAGPGALGIFRLEKSLFCSAWEGAYGGHDMD